MLGRGPGTRQRSSLARALTAALLGLTLVLAAIAAVGVGRMFDARQDYEDALASSYALESAGASLQTTGLLTQADVPAATRRRARPAFAAAAALARRRAAGDAPSERLVKRAVAARGDAAGLARAVEALRREQVGRRERARDRTRDRTRSALVLAVVAGGLALAGALALVAALVGGIRRPLDALVGASRRLADGDLASRVEPAGPSELRELHGAFNEMASGLEQAQRRVESDRARLAVVIESLGDGLVVCDANGEVESVNPRAAELIPALAPGTDSTVAGSALPSLERGLDGDVEVLVGDRTLSVTAGRLPGEDAGVVWTLRDISGRARLEAMKTEFVATASHELRSPLTSIKGFVELLGRSDALGAREREFVDVVLQSTDRLVELVNDLLDIARLEAGRLELRREPVHPAALIEGVAEGLRPRFSAEGRRLVLDLARDLPDTDADPVRLRQVLHNLALNALAHCEDGGLVTIAGDRDGEELVLAVSDTGAGMAPEDAARVFDRFVRHDSDADATGLGLSLARSLVDLHGGDIDVRSRVGEGTVFTVRLPALTGAVA